MVRTLRALGTFAVGGVVACALVGCAANPPNPNALNPVGIESEQGVAANPTLAPASPATGPNGPNGSNGSNGPDASDGSTGSDESHLPAASGSQSTEMPTRPTGERPVNMAGLSADEVLGWNRDYFPLATLGAAGWEASAEVVIDLAAAPAAAATGTGVGVQDNVVTISQPGNYRVTGTLPDGQVVVDTPGAFRLILDGADIGSATGAPLQITNAASAAIYLEPGSSNRLVAGLGNSAPPQDGSQPDAALYTKADAVISGTGSLTIVANWNDGISAAAGLVITSGTINIGAVDEAIAAEDFLVITGGTVSAQTGDDGLAANSQSDPATGYIAIRGGVVNISAASDGIDAITDFVMDGGEVTISATGEGIEAANINLGGGKLDIISGEDALNATVQGQDSNANQVGAALSITGGNLHAVGITDGFDSNGLILVTGGTTILETSTGGRGSGGIDANGTVTLTGGTMLIAGNPTTNDVVTQGQGWITTTGSGAGPTVSVIGPSGNALGSFTLSDTTDELAFTSADVVPGSAYSLDVGGTTWGSVTATNMLPRSGGGGRGR